jgi:hypothetical protein
MIEDYNNTCPINGNMQTSWYWIFLGSIGYVMLIKYLSKDYIFCDYDSDDEYNGVLCV